MCKSLDPKWAQTLTVKTTAPLHKHNKFDYIPSSIAKNNMVIAYL
jgi:hypothetical protein